MVRVVRRAVAEHLGVDPRAAADRALELLEQQHAGALAHDEPGARRVERARGERRILLLGDEPAHRAEAGEDHRMHAGLGAAREDDVGVAAANRLRALPHRVGAGRARRDRRVVRAAEAEVDRDLPARRVDEDVGEEPRRDPRVAALAEHLVLLEHADDAADRRADEDAGPRGIDPLDARVGPRLARRRDGEHDVALEPARVLRPDDGLRLEALHLGRDADRELARVERADPVDAAPPRDAPRPRSTARRARAG